MLGLSLSKNAGPSLRFQDARYMYMQLHVLSGELNGYMHMEGGSIGLIPSLVSYEISQGKNLWLKCSNYFMKMTNCLYYYI